MTSRIELTLPGDTARTAAPRSWLRSPERRVQLALAAARQFHRRGFHQVSMADVAGAVGLSAPAVYRHYRSKEDLLGAAIAGALDTVDVGLTTAETAPLPKFLRVMADAAVARPDLWTLLQRELRHLSPEQRAPLQQRFRRIVGRFTSVVGAARPDLEAPAVQLLTTAVLAVMASPSVYRRTGSADQQRTLLADAAEAVCQDRRPAPMPVAPLPMTAGGRPGDAARTRSEELLTTAIRLFADKGYAAVSLDEIAAELGMAGPSVYHYFAAKADILVVALARATERLAAQREGARQPLSIDALAGAYIDLALRERPLLCVYLWEAVHLPPEAGRRTRAALQTDVDAWCATLVRARPGLTTAQCLVLVHAARTVVHDVVRIGRWQERDDIANVLGGLVGATLATEVGG